MSVGERNRAGTGACPYREYNNAMGHRKRGQATLIAKEIGSKSSLSPFNSSQEGIDMILDVLENAHRYLALNKGFAKAIEFLLRPDLKELPVGKYEIDGDRVYATVSKDAGRKKEDALLETHEKYIDIQLVLAGTDDMGWKPRSLCKQPAGEYDQKRDMQFFADEPDGLALN